MKTLSQSIISRGAGFLAALLLATFHQRSSGAVVSATAELDQFVEKWLADSKVSGVSIGLLKEGALVLAKGYGLADRQTPLVPTADTVWSMASCSKPVVDPHT